MKVIFNLKGEQQNELLLNLIFPDYPDGNDGENENSAKEKETDNSVSNSAGCAYTPVMCLVDKNTAVAKTENVANCVHCFVIFSFVK